MNKSSLIVRLALVISFSSVAIGFLSTQFFYRLTYLKEVDLANHNIKQLNITVSPTAAIAAYLSDKELAREVVNGLSSNEFVENASMSFDDIIVSSASKKLDEPYSFPILSPFEKEKNVGYLFIQPNLKYIENRARQLGESNAIAMLTQAFVVSLVAIFISFYMIARPMVNIARSLHEMSPGSKDRLKIPEFHLQSEMGDLVRDTNKLLEKTEAQFSEERNLRREIEILEKRFRMLFENSLSPIVLLEPRGTILLFNNAFEKLIKKLGYSYRKSFGPLLEDLFFEPEKLHKSVQISFSNEEISTGEYKLSGDDDSESEGVSVWVQVVANTIVSEDMKEYYQVTLHDISKRKKELERLSHQADFDQLTNLYNRRGLEKIITKNIKSHSNFAIILMDLNHFKPVNDVYGHDSGDEILVHVADKIKKSIRLGDYASRWGGDEFILYLKEASYEDVRSIAKRVQYRISKPYYLRKFNENVIVSASMGSVFYPTDGEEMQGLLSQADQAMYKIKKQKDQNPEEFLLFSLNRRHIKNDQPSE